MQEDTSNGKRTLFEIIDGSEQFDNLIAGRRSVVIFTSQNNDRCNSYISKLKQYKPIHEYLILHGVDLAVIDADKNKDIATREKVRVLPQTMGYSNGKSFGTPQFGSIEPERFIESCIERWYLIPPKKS